MAQWLHFTGELDNYVTFWCGCFSGFHIPKNIKIGSFLTELFKKWQVVFSGPWCASFHYKSVVTMCLSFSVFERAQHTWPPVTDEYLVGYKG